MGKPPHAMADQDKLIDAFEKAGATNADVTVNASELGVGPLSWVKKEVLEKFLELGIVSVGSDNGYFLNTDKARALQENRTGIHFWRTAPPQDGPA